MPARAARAPARAQYKSLYFRRMEDHERVLARASAQGLSFSEYVIKAALGEAGPSPEVAERLRAAEEESRYWRERFERMAALAEGTQAEVLQLRAEIRTRAAGLGPGAGGGATAGDAAASALAPRLIVVFTSLRSADGKYRVWTESELLDDLGLARDPAGAEHLRSALATLYRTNLIEPQRNGWRYRESA